MVSNNKGDDFLPSECPQRTKDLVNVIIKIKILPVACIINRIVKYTGHNSVDIVQIYLRITKMIVSQYGKT